MEQTKPLFRVGGHYRNKRGHVVTLVAHEREGDFEALSMREGGGRGVEALHRLSDGVNDEHYCAPEFDLIPGELHQVDGQWVPVEAAAPRSDYFQQQLSEEADKAWSDLQKVSTALPPIAGLSFLPDVAKHSHQVAPGHCLAAKFSVG
jgi:hypothetical protein